MDSNLKREQNYPKRRQQKFLTVDVNKIIPILLSCLTATLCFLSLCPSCEIDCQYIGSHFAHIRNLIQQFFITIPSYPSLPCNYIQLKELSFGWVTEFDAQAKHKIHCFQGSWWIHISKTVPLNTTHRMKTKTKPINNISKKTIPLQSWSRPRARETGYSISQICWCFAGPPMSPPFQILHPLQHKQINKTTFAMEYFN